MMLETAAGGPDSTLSSAEEGRGVLTSHPRSSSAAASPRGTSTSSRRSERRYRWLWSSLVSRRSRLLSGFLLFLYVLHMVKAGALNWMFVAWGFCGSLLFISCVWLARIVHVYLWRSSAARRRQRLSPRALEARLQLRHPGIELGRLRLLLVDRDFTGEDYQALLELDDNNEVPPTVGASEAEIRRNPSFLIKEPAPDSVAKPKSCSICLYPFKPNERVRIIPCLHQFHTECIDPWLRQNAICPICKFPVVG